MRSSFQPVVAFVLDYESGGDPNGGDHVDPKDPGGRTRWGFSQRGHPDIDFDAFTRDQAQDRYLEEYWQPAGCDELPAELDASVFDFAVNAGVVQAVKTLQRTVGNSANLQTGVLGGITRRNILAQLKAVGAEALTDLYLTERVLWYTKEEPGDHYDEGWVDRCFKLHRFMIRRGL